MKTFKDLDHQKNAIGGTVARLSFDNGYGVSVIKGGIAYGGGSAPYELAVLKDGGLCYDTDITDDVLGHLTPTDVTGYMRQVQEL